jgi:hypothetical protein
MEVVHGGEGMEARGCSGGKEGERREIEKQMGTKE